MLFAIILGLAAISAQVISDIAQKQTAEYEEKKAELDELNRKLDLTRAEITSIKRSMESIKSDEGAEDAVRRDLGRVKNGDIVYICSEPKDAAATKEQKTAHGQSGQNAQKN
ncbi:septum formation initiator family protein [bacterium]|nr:septum formation initiator family protein [bacterium]